MLKVPWFISSVPRTCFCDLRGIVFCAGKPKEKICYLVSLFVPSLAFPVDCSLQVLSNIRSSTDANLEQHFANACFFSELVRGTHFVRRCARRIAYVSSCLLQQVSSLVTKLFLQAITRNCMVELGLASWGQERWQMAVHFVITGTFNATDCWALGWLLHVTPGNRGPCFHTIFLTNIISHLRT